MSPGRLPAAPERLPCARIELHPSLQLQRSPFAIVSLWAAHQGAGASEPVALERPESALVLRDGDAVWVLGMAPADAAFVGALAAGAALGAAASIAEAAADGTAPFELSAVLALLIGRHAIVGWHDAGEAR